MGDVVESHDIAHLGDKLLRVFQQFARRVQPVLGDEPGKGHSLVSPEPDAEGGAVQAHFGGDVVQGDWAGVMRHDVFADLLHAADVAVGVRRFSGWGVVRGGEDEG